MQDVRIGEKLYHWRYGTVTVIGIDYNYIETKIDNPNGIVYLEGDSYNPYYKEPIKKFPKDSVGYWLFLNKNDIGKENDGTNIKQGQFPNAIIFPCNLDKLHKSFDKETVENTQKAFMKEFKKKIN